MSRLGRLLVDTDAGMVHVWTKSGEGLPLLLLHMSPRSGRMYHPILGLLDRPAAAPDRLGFGFSDHPVAHPTIADYAMATLEVVNSLGWERFDVIGTHTGAVEAIELAHRAASRVARLGLVSLPAYTPEEIQARRSPGGVAAPRPATSLDGSHLVARWNRRVAIRSGQADPDFLHELFLDEMLSAPGTHLAYQAVIQYPTLERLLALRRDVIVFSPVDDLRTQTERAIPLLPPSTTLIDLPHLDFDLWNTAPEQLLQLINTHFPADQKP